jgi:predicted nucleotidyltransferase
MMNSPTNKGITLDELRARRDEILALAARYGAYNVRVFGSVARNESAPDSDIDLLVNFEDWVSLYELAGLKHGMEELLGCKVDIVEDHDRLRERFRRRILQDGVEL